MDSSTKYDREFYVAFYEGQSWVTRFTGKRWGHVRLFYESLGGALTTEIDFKASTTQIREHAGNFWENMYKADKKPHTVMRGRVSMFSDKHIRLRPWLSCVEVVKSFLGIKQFCITPRMLYTILESKAWEKVYATR